MAIIVNIPVEMSGIGTAISEAYARVAAFQWSAQDKKFVFAVEYFWNEAARRSDFRPIGSQTFQIDEFDFSVDISVKKTCYMFLKTLPAFKEAKDV